MQVSVNLYSSKKGEINKFLSSFYNTHFNIANDLSWEKKYANPIELAEIVGAFIDNCENFHINMWICLDANVFIRIAEDNANSIIKYLYERFPY